MVTDYFKIATYYNCPRVMIYLTSPLYCENCDGGRDVTAKDGGGVRVRIAVGTIGTVSATLLASSKVAFGEDIERPFGFLEDTGDGDGQAEGGTGSDSIGWVWLRVGSLRSLPRSCSISFAPS